MVSAQLDAQLAELQLLQQELVLMAQLMQVLMLRLKMLLQALMSALKYSELLPVLVLAVFHHLVRQRLDCQQVHLIEDCS
jgi:hypothetical protein